jgi:hypothetical protein
LVATHLHAQVGESSGLEASDTWLDDIPGDVERKRREEMNTAFSVIHDTTDGVYPDFSDFLQRNSVELLDYAPALDRSDLMTNQRPYDTGEVVILI